MLAGLNKRVFRKGASFLIQIMVPDADVGKLFTVTTPATKY